MRTPFLLVIAIGAVALLVLGLVYFFPGEESNPARTEKPIERLELPEDPEQRVQVLLDRAIELAGGLEAWKAIDNLSYRVVERNFNLNNGQLMWEMTRSFFLKPHERKYRMEDYTENGNPHFLVFDGREGFLKMMGELLRNVESRESARGELLTEARYMSMPFSLLDPGVELEYIGPGDFEGRPVEQVSAVFQEGLESRILPDRYEVHFDAETGEFVGLSQLVVIEAGGERRESKRNHGYQDHVTVGGVRLPTLRVQFGSKASLDQPRVRLRISHFEIQKDYDDSLFVEPVESGDNPFYRENLERVRQEQRERRARQEGQVSSGEDEEDGSARDNRPK